MTVGMTIVTCVGLLCFTIVVLFVIVAIAGRHRDKREPVPGDCQKCRVLHGDGMLHGVRNDLTLKTPSHG